MKFEYLPIALYWLSCSVGNGWLSCCDSCPPGYLSINSSISIYSHDRWVTVHCLTHWGRVTHICVGNLTIIGSDNGLSPGRRQAITWTNVGILLIGPLGTNFSEVLIGIHTVSFKKIHLKMSGKWQPFCLGLNVLTLWGLVAHTYDASVKWVNAASWNDITCSVSTKPLPKSALTHCHLYL